VGRRSTGTYPADMDERDLVQQLATKPLRLTAMRALVGGVTSTELRNVKLSDAAFEALREGVTDPNPKVRWWSIQLLDHVADPRAIIAVAGALDDPVPRVRRNAAHAVGCAVCKPSWTDPLPGDIAAALSRLAATDPNAKVRAEARRSLARSA
jgi:HEAT repeat protein